jgi:hypothetical protein
MVQIEADGLDQRQIKGPNRTEERGVVRRGHGSQGINRGDAGQRC